MCGTQPSASDTACDVVVTGRPGLPPIAAATSPAWQGSHLDGIRRPLLRHSPTVGPLGIPLPAVPHYIFANSLHAFEKLPSYQISKLTAPLLSTPRTFVDQTSADSVSGDLALSEVRCLLEDVTHFGVLTCSASLTWRRTV